MAIQSEAWLPVVGWEGWYEVSDLGSVRSVDRVAETARGPWHYRSRTLKFNLIQGRPYVDLRRPGAREHVAVSRLVALAHLGPGPEGHDVCHDDGQPHHNNAGNLRWDTKRGNMADKVRHGTDHYGKRLACSRNHVYTEATTYLTVNASGGPKRVCRTCVNDRAKEKRRLARTNGEEHT